MLIFIFTTIREGESRENLEEIFHAILINYLN